MHIKKEDEYKYLIRQQGSLLFDQIEQIRGYETQRINELIFVEAKHNKKRLPQLRRLLKDGFYYNGVHYVRFGKSNSQAKNGVTVFIDEEFYDEMMERSQLGVDIDKCVISKYESYRCLIFSACELVEEELPHIVIVDEYTKVLPDQYVRYAVEKDVEYIDQTTQQKRTYKQRTIEEGYHDIKISPFDGFGCHTEKVSKLFAKYCDLDYVPIAFQVRLPFLKGMSVQAPIQEFYRDKGITEITDIFGRKHKVEDIDCIWNVSMWKAYKIFKNEFGDNAWDEYIARVKKYGYKIGISKYSKHIDDIDIVSRVNFQYLQCLDLLNDKYVQAFKNKERYDILDEKNWGKIINIAKYSTDLLEKIIKGDKFYTLKFLGINDTEADCVSSKYVEAILINDAMLKDPCIKNMLRRKLEKIITQMKFGKIYVEGFYHIAVGDIIGYLEYAAGLDVKGCLGAHQFYCNTTIPLGKCLSFRSPLVDPSEVNEVEIVHNEYTEKYLSHFKDQNMVMINMYDLTMPQQGGCDFDGDILFLCHNPIIISSKINKPIVVDIDDKKSAKEVEYNQENIIEYECNSRDNRIGEITNVATSILNQYTEDPYWQKVNADKVSLLRLYQGKEIDFLKVGYRWVLTKNLRKHLKKLPYFLLYNYPQKLNVYNRIRKINQEVGEEDKIPYNAYHSPSPLNELCEYINQWEKRKIIWDNSVINNGDLLIDNSLDLSNKHIIKKIKKIYNDFKKDFKKYLEQIQGEDDENGQISILFDEYRKRLSEINIDYELLANYCIKVAYSSLNETKVLCWALFGDVILKNLKKNSPTQKHCKIIQTTKDDKDALEFLGKYYKLVEVQEGHTSEFGTDA